MLEFGSILQVLFKKNLYYLPLFLTHSISLSWSALLQIILLCLLSLSWCSFISWLRNWKENGTMQLSIITLYRFESMLHLKVWNNLKHYKVYVLLKWLVYYCKSGWSVMGYTAPEIHFQSHFRSSRISGGTSVRKTNVVQRQL